MSEIENFDKKEDRQGSNLTEAFLLFRSSLEKLVRRIVGKDDVDDIVSDAYLKTYEHFGEQKIAYPKAFLYKTARNLALNHIAKHENRFTHSIEDIPVTDVYLTSEQLESQVEVQEKFRIFCDAVDLLPPKCRQAFVLKRIYGISTKEIAKEMKISTSTAEKHIAKGLLLCAEALAKNGYDLKGIASKAEKQNGFKKQ